MVCLGNICRSPLAEGILQSKLPATEFLVDSAGTGAWHAGEQPDPRSIATAQKHSIDLTNQKARQFKVSDFDTFDRIYVMDTSNYNDVLKLVTNEKQKLKVKLILEENPQTNLKEVPDPYYGGQEGFDLVFEMLDTTCNKIANELLALNNK